MCKVFALAFVRPADVPAAFEYLAGREAPRGIVWTLYNGDQAFNADEERELDTFINYFKAEWIQRQTNRVNQSYINLWNVFGMYAYYYFYKY